MVREQENGHHDLMNGRDGGLSGVTRREDDFLNGVAAAAGHSQDTDDQSVGQRIHALRQAKGLSLDDVAQRTGIAAAELAEIESDEASPPLGTLIKLGKALEMKLGTLIAGGDDRAYTVVRAAERQAMSRFASQRGSRYGYSYQALAPNKKNRTMEPFIVTLEPAAGDVAASAHDGEEFIFVLEGAMEATVGDDVMVLEPGDSIYYDSTAPHLVRPAGDTATRILAVLYAKEK